MGSMVPVVEKLKHALKAAEWLRGVSSSMWPLLLWLDGTELLERRHVLTSRVITSATAQ